MKKGEYYWIEYIFNIFSHKIMKFTILLDKKTLLVEPPVGAKEKEWTVLGFHKCDICPFDKDKVRNCPIAYNISYIAESFTDVSSTEETEITVNVESRTYKRTDTVNEGLKSIMGIYMATSGCPHMDLLKPMARFHLPFATMEETVYRHIGNYFINEFNKFLSKKLDKIDVDDFRKRYELINKVNLGIFNRIKHISEKDASTNAIVTLNAFGQMVGMELDYELETIKHLFDSIEK
jgi:hypothetical protein